MHAPDRIGWRKAIGWGTAIVFLVWILGGILDPVDFWTSHFPHYLHSPILRWGLPLAGIAGVLGWLFLPESAMRFRLPTGGETPLLLANSFLPVGIFVLLWYFPIPTDLYGDHYFIVRTAHETEQLSDDRWEFFKDAFTSSPFEKKSGNLSVIPLAVFLKLTMERSGASDYVKAYGIIHAFFGALFVWLAMMFIRRQFRDSPLWAAGITLMMLTSGFMLFFFPYCELYPPAFFCFLLYYIALAGFARNPGWGRWFLLLLIGLLCLKYHASSVTLIPSLFLAGVLCLVRDLDKRKAWIFRPRFLFTVILPSILIPFILFYFINGDYNHGPVFSRDSQIGQQFKWNFLPLFPEKASIDRGYSLHSFMHLFDFANLFLFVAPGAVLLVVHAIASGVNFREKAWEWIPLSVALAGQLLFAFCVNPLLGMQRDWDMVSLFAPGLFVFSVVCFRRVPDEKKKTVLLPLAGIMVFSLSTFFLNLDAKRIPHRLADVSVRMFRTYVMTSDIILNNAAYLMPTEDEEWALRERYLPAFSSVDDPRDRWYFFFSIAEAQLKSMAQLASYERIGSFLDTIDKQGIPLARFRVAAAKALSDNKRWAEALDQVAKSDAPVLDEYWVEGLRAATALHDSAAIRSFTRH